MRTAVAGVTRSLKSFTLKFAVARQEPDARGAANATLPGCSGCVRWRTAYPSACTPRMPANGATSCAGNRHRRSRRTAIWLCAWFVWSCNSSHDFPTGRGPGLSRAPVSANAQAGVALRAPKVDASKTKQRFLKSCSNKRDVFTYVPFVSKLVSLAKTQSETNRPGVS